MNVLDRINKGLFFLDGGTGSRLQARGLKAGELPELWNISHPEEITALARDYYEAGSNAVLTNTFGANRFKFTGSDGSPSVEEIVLAAYSCTSRARQEAKGEMVQEDRYIALDVGPLGRMLEPMGDLSFEDAVEAFAEVVRAGVKAGVDYIFIETMNDAYETKAAVLAAKENSDLPVLVSNVYNASSRLLTGADPKVMTAILEGLGVDAEGSNCSLGPYQMLELIPQIYEAASLPVIAKPNAGMPRVEDGRTVYDVTPDEFASCMADMVRCGARLIGGCCGTTPEHIKKMVLAAKDIEPLPVICRDTTVVTSGNEAVVFGEAPVLIGERINPTGKEKFKEALRNGDIDFIVDEGLDQEDANVHIIDINVGLPGIDEADMLLRGVKELQSVTRLPLQIDSSDTRALERAMREYNGKPMINSVNGKKNVMEAVFPLVAKYGGLLVCLTLDEDGIPKSAEGRLDVARKIALCAEKYGIDKRNLIFDPLVLAVSAQPEAARVTLDAAALIRSEMGVHTLLGISNISFGLPKRGIIESVFLAMAMERGISAAMVNPYIPDIMKTYHSFCALSGLDISCSGYIGYVSGIADSPAVKKAGGDGPLISAIIKGLKDDAGAAAKELLASKEPQEVIDEHIIPALDLVGGEFEKKTMFLPQLLMSAEAAKAAFAEIKRLAKANDGSGPKMLLATVKGDIHDIGKNIVKVLLENYGFTVIDLGKDVPPDEITDCIIKNDIKLAGLSALMTTSVPAMEDTIEAIRKKCPDCKVIVGGAVITQEYADTIGADHYGESAMDTVRYAQEVLTGTV